MDCVPTFFLFIIKHGKEINWVMSGLRLFIIPMSFSYSGIS